jgi:hypothetical protein
MTAGMGNCLSKNLANALKSEAPIFFFIQEIETLNILAPTYRNTMISSMKIKVYWLLLLLCAYHSLAKDNFSITQPYDFPIKPGAQAWSDLGGFYEKTLACEIPVVQAKNMTTEALVQTCMNYPLDGNASLYESTAEQDAFFNNFYGFKELATRTDAGACLNKYYDLYSRSFVKAKDPSIAMISFMHWFLSRKEILAQFTPEQKEQLAILSLNNVVSLSKSAKNNNLVIFPVRVVLCLLIEENIAIHKKGKTFDKSKLPSAALKYLRGETIDKSESNWCLTIANTYYKFNLSTYQIEN